MKKFEKCSVCGWDMKDGGIKIQIAGKELTVCCDDCAKAAKRDHESSVKSGA